MQFGGSLFAGGVTELLLENSTFTKSSAGFGGAVYLQNSVALLKNVHFENNRAMFGGGAVYWTNIPGTIITFNDVTYSNNNASFGEDVCTSIDRIVAEPAVVDSTSGSELPTDITVSMLDVYGQRIKTLSELALFANTNDGQVSILVESFVHCSYPHVLCVPDGRKHCAAYF